MFFVHPIKPVPRCLLLLALLAGIFQPGGGARALAPDARPAMQEVTAYDLIIAMNTLRISNGLPALIEDPIINAVAQSTAEIMAANQMSWHIGDVSGRLTAAGYGGGAKVWATENFAVGVQHSIDTIMLAWSDPSHMIPALNPAYCNVGAGVAKAANGMTYYVLQAAYTSAKACGEYKSPVDSGNTGGQQGQTGQTGSTGGVPGIIVPVKIATPDADGNVYHVVQPGQSFWSIAIAYKVTIKDIEVWNNLSSNAKLQIGQKLFIPGPNTKGYATPTPVGMILANTPDPDGKIVHVVASHQTLYTIAEAYKVTVDRILALNGWQVDWPLQIDQKLLIDPGRVTPSPTPRPLTPVEKLTPAADGKYYHVVKSGETLSWIAELYEVNLADLMRWNGLNNSSILHPDQKLLLEVTPPATATPTPGPPTDTPEPTPEPPTATATQPATATLPAEPTVVAQAVAGPPLGLLAGLGVTALGLMLAGLILRRRPH